MTRAEHRAFDPVFRSPTGAVPAGTAVTLSVAADETPTLRLWSAEDGERLLAPAFSSPGGETTRLYAFTFSVSAPGIVWYRFLFSDGALVPGDDPLVGVPAPPDAFASFQLTVFDPAFSVPEWTAGRVMYQIFPDRLARGRDFSPVPGRVTHARWDEDVTVAPLPGKAEYTAYDFFGGTLRGIEEHLDDLAALGVTALYLNPVFRAASNHRYDVGDYTRVDPALGTEDDYAALCAAARARGIRILGDGVFSHTGEDSVYFDRFGREAVPGAYQSKSSPYFPWYRFRTWPDDYACWWNVRSLPEVNEEDPGFSAFINGPDGVARLWLRRGASGWRLDVADELPDGFLEAFRASVKAEDPEAFVLGEVWEDATNKVSYGRLRRYLLGSQLDSVMNYPFRRAILDLLTGRLDAGGFVRRVRTVLSNYPGPCVHALMNFLSTHDTPRITSLLGGMPEDVRREDAAGTRLSPEARALALRRHAAAAA
ncbi:MAG: glycoside hydrolase family 13 protein, partial [Oscillospiraceae bacterium]|nr:glycoside hydrolase family 13 protein [Oscillospiraceae bacterium]